MSLANKPWTEKYRPSKFENIISHSLIKNIITKLINNKNFFNLILYGPPGVGKTTLMYTILNNIYGENYKLYVLELNGSDDRGINIVRDKIKTYASTSTLYNNNNKLKLIILDEVDSMTQDAQHALKEIIEMYEYNTKFCLICNFINKLIYPLQSGCIMFRLQSIGDDDIKYYLKNIIDQEKINYTNEGINSIIKLSDRDLRKSCNNLQSVYLSFNNITKNNVYECLGVPKQTEINNIFSNIKNKNLIQNIKFINNLRIKSGYSLNELIKNIFNKILEMNIDNNDLINFISVLGDIEYNVSNLGTDKIQINSLVALLIKYKNIF